jgi:uncharacterized protein with NRDE domain
MCTLLLWKREHPRFTLIAAANRDEFLDRASTAPVVLDVDPLVVGGRDEVAVTNRRGAGVHDPTRRSRGVLVKQLAHSRSHAQALEAVARIDARAYNPFILLIADANDAAAVHAGDDGLRVTAIPDGAHAITNWDLDALKPLKAARALRIAQATTLRADDDAAAIACGLHVTLADHGASGDGRDGEGGDEHDGEGGDEHDAEGGDGREAGLCVHRTASSYGTRSSTIAMLGASPADTALFHAEGPPCTAALVDVTALLRHESRTAYAKE